MNLFYQPLIGEGIHHLDEEESRHCIKVLRKQSGELIHITDGKGFFYEALISKADSRQCGFIIQQKIQEQKRDFTIHIAIAPTKNADRLEWFVEKSTELGIDQITLLDCKNSERSFNKTDRLIKVAVSAMKQSLKATLPLLNSITPFPSFIESPVENQKCIAFVDSENPLHLQHIAKPHDSYLVLIGPEGDFSKEELALAMSKDFKKVSLGQSRLRTETAGIAACHILNLINIKKD